MSERRVPPRLWIRIVLGNAVAQVASIALAVIAVGAPIVAWKNGPSEDSIPMTWVGAMAMIACAPLWLIVAVRARRQLQLLRHGVETEGKLLDKSVVRRGENGTVMHYTFQYFSAEGEQHINTTVTARSEASLEDGATEAMLYDPRRPERAIPLDHLSGSPKISETGELVARNPGVLWLLVAPVVAIVGLIGLYARA